MNLDRTWVNLGKSRTPYFQLISVCDPCWLLMLLSAQKLDVPDFCALPIGTTEFKHAIGQNLGLIACHYFSHGYGVFYSMAGFGLSSSRQEQCKTEQLHGELETTNQEKLFESKCYNLRCQNKSMHTKIQGGDTRFVRWKWKNPRENCNASFLMFITWYVVSLFSFCPLL